MKHCAFVVLLFSCFFAAAGSADSTSATYVDPEGLFSFSPPPGWQLVRDPSPNISDSRKIVFRPLSADASLTVLTKSFGPSGIVSIPTFPRVQEKEALGEDDSYVDEKGVMHATVVSGSSPRSRSYEFLAGSTHYKIVYKARSPSYENYGPVVITSIRSFKPAETVKGE